MSDVISVKGLQKKFKTFTMGPVDFDINKGALTMLLGCNGSGKTTLMKCICGQYVADTIEEEAHNEIKKLTKGFVFENCPFPDQYQVSKISKIMSKLFSDWNTQKFFELCLKLKIDPNKRIYEMSKGSKTKLQIAVNLSHEVDLLLLDEYSSGLDEQSKKVVLSELRKYLDDDKTIILSTHDSSNIYQYADYVILMKDGKIVFNLDIPTIQDTFGIIRTSTLDSVVDEDYVIISQKNGYGKTYLISNKKDFQNKYDQFAIETASIQDILSLYSEGAVGE